MRSVEIRAEEPLRRGALTVAFLVLLTAGCGGTKSAPPVAPSSATPSQTGAETLVPVAQPAAPPGPPAPTPTQSEATAVEPAKAPVTPLTSASSGPRDTKPAPPAPKAPPRVPAAQANKDSVPPDVAKQKAPPPAPSAQATRKDSAPPEVAKPKAPPLDLASLEARLKETKAIGVLSKIAISNQVDDLLDQFRDFYQGKLKITLAELRRPYDLLVLKVIALLQDSDPGLASALVASREAIWGVLSDRTKFAAI